MKCEHSPACPQQQGAHRTDPWAQDRDQKNQGWDQNRRLQVDPRSQAAFEEILLREMQGIRGWWQGGRHRVLRVRTSRCLLVGRRDKACLGKAQEELRGQRDMALLDRDQDLQETVLGLLQGGTARGTALALPDRRGTGLELLVQVETVQVFQDQRESHPELKAVLDIGLELRDLKGTRKVPGPPVQRVHCCSRVGLRAGWGRRGRKKATLDLKEDFQLEQKGWYCQFS